ncbi:unnamed protein product, partial [Ectocarpus fasciculatus]
DDSRKVYVSRLPLQWGEQHLAEHFSACFGPVESASVSYDRTNECSRGYGFVTFEKEEDKETAVAQGSLHAKKRNIQIKAVVREENVLGRGRDTGVCYMWQRYSCVKGNDCRFLHEGEGSCITVSAQGEGKKKCLSFKSKGKCSKGDACPFIHDRGSKAKAAAVSEKRTSAPDDFKKICHSFKKKGKCRKGESCIFSHDFGGDGEVKEKTSEKRR